MQYFVGTWACKVTPKGGPTLDVTVKFEMEAGILREWDDVQIPGAGGRYTISKSISYDAKNGRWVQAQNDRNGAWVASYLKPWKENTEEWLDVAASDSKLGKHETVRVSANVFAFGDYAIPSDPKPNTQGMCTRSR